MSTSIAKNINRSDLETILERRIVAWGEHFTPQEIEKLRHVAKTTDKIAVCDWKVDGCGCPLVQAGIPRFVVAEDFATEFDQDVVDFLQIDPKPTLINVF